MSNVQHGVFTIERIFDAPVSLVFRAWADGEAKANWFRGGEGWTELVREQDFRVGGEDQLKGRRDESGMISHFKNRYFDIVTDKRIIYTYEMFINGTKISTSLATIAFEAVRGGTKLVLTEQGAFLDGHDDAGSRERGTHALIDNLEAALRRKN